MKTYLLLIAFILIASTLSAQPEPGKVEVSLSGSYQNYASDGGTSSSAIIVSPRVGFFPFEGLEVEPELVFLLPTAGDALYMINGNLSYNFINGKKSFPFVLIGYGVSNSLPTFNLPIVNMGLTAGVLNAGGGVKAFIADNVAIRVEYRYQKFSGEKDLGTTPEGFLTGRRKVDFRIHSVQVGFSILL